MTQAGGSHDGDAAVPDNGPGAGHVPVMLAEVIKALQPVDGETIVDGTFGAGGYTGAILASAGAKVIAFDRDPSAKPAADAMKARFPGRFAFHPTPFSTMAELLSEPVDGVVLDIGVSSMQIDDPSRGFSFQTDGPLDMRMSAAGGEDLENAETAADLVNKLDEEDLANLIYRYGEERRSRAIARAICRRRTDELFATTADLAAVVAKVYGRPPKDGRNPATRTFQALRIAVNDELGELARGLYAAEAILRPGGRLVVVTFHSLEDRIVKRFFAERAGVKAGTSRHLPELEQFERPTFQILNQRPLTPGNQEIERNPRARSAKLRRGMRTGVPAGTPDFKALGLPEWDRR